jgi:hypothetical protein
MNPIGLIQRLVLALVVAVIVWLVCFFIGGLLAMMNVPLAAYVGDFLQRYAVVLAVLAFLWAFIRGV